MQSLFSMNNAYSVSDAPFELVNIWTSLTLCLRVRGGKQDRLKKTGRTGVGSKGSL